MPCSLKAQNHQKLLILALSTEAAKINSSCFLVPFVDRFSKLSKILFTVNEVFPKSTLPNSLFFLLHSRGRRPMLISAITLSAEVALYQTPTFRKITISTRYRPQAMRMIGQQDTKASMEKECSCITCLKASRSNETLLPWQRILFLLYVTTVKNMCHLWFVRAGIASFIVAVYA